MNTTPTLPSAGGTPGNKNFWSKPEGKTALLINGGIIAAVVYFWGSIVPFLLSAAVDTLHLMVVCAAIAGLLFVLFDGNFRRMAWYLYRSVMRWLTGQFVAIDPIGIMKTRKEEMQSKKNELEESVAEIRGQRIKLARYLEVNSNDYATSMNKLVTAKDLLQCPDGNKRRQAERIFTLETRQSERLDVLIGQQKTHMAHYDDVIAALSRYGEICDDAILDYGREIESRKQAQDSANSFRKGMRAAGAILRGMPEQEEADMAVAYLDQQYSAAIGEVENLLTLTKDVVATADFNDQTAITAMGAKIDAWKASSAVPAKAIAAPQEHITNPGVEFSQYFVDRKETK